MFSSQNSQVSNAANYIEDVFSTYLYTGNGSTQTINNGIDLSTKGGLVWIKSRTNGAAYHSLFDTVRGSPNILYTNTTSAQANATDEFGSFASNGFTVPVNTVYGYTNYSTEKYASWTFRKQPKFFDVVTYTGDGTAGRTVAHSLGSTPGCIIVKKTSGAREWAVYHRSLGATKAIYLNTTAAAYDDTTGIYWNSTAPTSTQFSVGTSSSTNLSGDTYVAYIFAHDAGGFGLSGNENVVSCGSFTASGGFATVTLGYEPQWLLVKQVDGVGNWGVYDTMRGIPTGSDKRVLFPNTSGAEINGNNPFDVAATGFNVTNSYAFPGTGSGNETFIYIAVRRGPMKTPTDGTKVFKPLTRTGTGATAAITGVGFTPDLGIFGNQSGYNIGFDDRLRGASAILESTSTAAESVSTTYASSWDMDGITVGGANTTNRGGYPLINWFFKRAPSFFDVVCYIQPGSSITVTHNLKAVPELIILKNRNNGASNWMVYSAALGNTKYLNLETNGAETTASWAWDNTSPTSTTFVNGYIYPDNTNVVAYLFATCAGVSKVGSYTGTGTTQQINCGFAAGARFVLIKRTDSTGDWYVWDTARGIVSGNDPYLLLNSTAAETTTTDYIDTYAAGFELSSTAPAALNASGGTYIFLAIA